MNAPAQVQTQVSTLISQGTPLATILNSLSNIPTETIIDTYDALRMEQFDTSMMFDDAA